MALSGACSRSIHKLEIRRAAVEPQVKARVDGVEETLEALVECLPARMPPVADR